MAPKDKKQDSTKKDTKKTTKKTATTASAEAPQQNETGAAPQFGMMVHTQYVKDFSFENPNAPETLGGGQTQPKLDANINMHARALNKDEALYEVVLDVSASATRDNKTLFVAEVQYGVVASVKGVPEEHHHPLLSDL